MNLTGLLPIGQFAQASGLTVIALRHYDATGVLPPALVDPASGYRYYARDQVPTAQLVRLLRQVEVPVDRIPALLARIEAGEDVLPELTATLDRRTASARAALEQLRIRLSAEGEDMAISVMLRNKEAQAFLVTTARLVQGEAEAFGRAAYEKLYLAASRGPLTLPGRAFFRFHSHWNDAEPTLMDACLPYWIGGAEPRDLPDGVETERHPGGRFAGLMVNGASTAYPAITAAYDAVAEWITRHGFEFDGPSYEFYEVWSGEVGHPNNILEIGFWITG